MLNWLVIGIGDITRKRVIPAIQAEKRSSFYAVLTRDPRKADEYSGTKVYTDLSDALKDERIDAVYVASPVVVHAEHTIASIEAAKQVLCEKPVAMNYRQAEEMAEAVHRSGLVCGVAYFRRGFPKLVRAKELVAEGAIGKPLFVEAVYHSWLESDERAWLRDPKIAGGGPLYDVGSHRIDACNFLFGKPSRAMGLMSDALHGMKIEDSATTLIEYAGGVHASIDVRWNSRISRDEFRIIGVEGEIQMTPLSGPQLRVVRADGSVHEESLPPHGNVHFPVVENFAAAVLHGAPLMCPMGEAIWTDWVTEQVRVGNSR